MCKCKICVWAYAPKKKIHIYLSANGELISKVCGWIQFWEFFPKGSKGMSSLGYQPRGKQQAYLSQHDDSGSSCVFNHARITTDPTYQFN